MKPHPRIRKTIKYGGAALTVLLVVVWIGSATNWVSYLGVNGRGFVVGQGEVSIYTTETWQLPPKVIGWRRNVVGAGTGFWADTARTRLIWPIRVRFWPAICFVLLPTAIAFRLDHLARRRERMHLCTKCHYDRTGLAFDAVCPECGVAAGPVAKDQ